MHRPPTTLCSSQIGRRRAAQLALTLRCAATCVWIPRSCKALLNARFAKNGCSARTETGSALLGVCAMRQKSNSKVRQVFGLSRICSKLPRMELGKGYTDASLGKCFATIHSCRPDHRANICVFIIYIYTTADRQARNLNIYTILISDSGHVPFRRFVEYRLKYAPNP